MPAARRQLLQWVTAVDNHRRLIEAEAPNAQVASNVWDYDAMAPGSPLRKPRARSPRGPGRPLGDVVAPDPSIARNSALKRLVTSQEGDVKPTKPWRRDGATATLHETPLFETMHWMKALLVRSGPWAAR